MCWYNKSNVLVSEKAKHTFIPISHENSSVVLESGESYFITILYTHKSVDTFYKMTVKCPTTLKLKSGHFATFVKINNASLVYSYVIYVHNMVIASEKTS